MWSEIDRKCGEGKDREGKEKEKGRKKRRMEREKEGEKETGRTCDLHRSILNPFQSSLTWGLYLDGRSEKKYLTRNSVSFKLRCSVQGFGLR